MSSTNAKNANENSFSFNQTLLLELVKQATISLSTVQQIINIFYASNNNNIIENDLGGINNFDQQNKHFFEEGKGLLKQTTRVLNQMSNVNSQDGVTNTQVTSVNGGNIINTRNIQQSEHQLNYNNNIISGNASFDKNTTLQGSIDTTGGNISMDRIETRNRTCMDLNINNNVINEECKNKNMHDDCKTTNNSGSNEQSEWIIAGFKKYYYNKAKLKNVDKKNNNTTSSTTFTTIKSTTNNIEDNLTYKYRVSKYTY